MRSMIALLFGLATTAAAQGQSLSIEDLEGRWRLSAVSSAKYGCDIPGAMNVEFKKDGEGGLIGIYTVPSLSETFSQKFVPYASLQSVLTERGARGRAITLNAPKAMRRILVVETSIGPHERPSRLEWASLFGGFGEEPGIFDSFVPSAWLTRCP
jgi:hypothetical protein